MRHLLFKLLTKVSSSCFFGASAMREASPLIQRDPRAVFSANSGELVLLFLKRFEKIHDLLCGIRPHTAAVTKAADKARIIQGSLAQHCIRNIQSALIVSNHSKKFFASHETLSNLVYSPFTIRL
ncbi:hypothetical protein AKG12_00570 [Agrobacterium sp. SUL3]|nr:hypothetical protein AKG12_00570 [Agrobacterium sp. SUL3]